MKRRWFQIHLLTTVVLVFLAGALLFANIRVVDTGVTIVSVPPQTKGYFRTFEVGWPFKWLERTHILAARGDPPDPREGPFNHPPQYDLNPPSLEKMLSLKNSDMTISHILYWPLVGNVSLALLFACFTAFVIERLVRRSEARKP